MTGFKLSTVSFLEIERPERYVKQLNSHLSKKASLQEGFLLFPELGAGQARVLPGAIQITAYADTQEALEKIQNILAKHLYKFAKIEDADPIWIKSLID